MNPKVHELLGRLAAWGRGDISPKAWASNGRCAACGKPVAAFGGLRGTNAGRTEFYCDDSCLDEDSASKAW